MLAPPHVFTASPHAELSYSTPPAGTYRVRPARTRTQRLTMSKCLRCAASSSTTCTGGGMHSSIREPPTHRPRTRSPSARPGSAPRPVRQGRSTRSRLRTSTRAPSSPYSARCPHAQARAVSGKLRPAGGVLRTVRVGHVPRVDLTVQVLHRAVLVHVL
eukprot:scaffold4850_cov340-Prasinococcus_capsulatus_cf.AAC.2